MFLIDILKAKFGGGIEWKGATNIRELNFILNNVRKLFMKMSKLDDDKKTKKGCIIRVTT